MAGERDFAGKRKKKAIEDRQSRTADYADDADAGKRNGHLFQAKLFAGGQEANGFGEAACFGFGEEGFHGVAAAQRLVKKRVGSGGEGAAARQRDLHWLSQWHPKRQMRPGPRALC